MTESAIFSIHEDVLADILNTHRAEATDMILEEYNEELHIRNEKEISFDEGNVVPCQDFLH